MTKRTRPHTWVVLWSVAALGCQAETSAAPDGFDDSVLSGVPSAGTFDTANSAPWLAQGSAAPAAIPTPMPPAVSAAAFPTSPSLDSFPADSFPADSFPADSLPAGAAFPPPAAEPSDVASPPPTPTQTDAADAEPAMAEMTSEAADATPPSTSTFDAGSGELQPDGSTVIFRIADGTGGNDWNSMDDPVRVKRGMVLRIIDEDKSTRSGGHYLHTYGQPCPHGSRMIGDGYDCVISERAPFGIVDGVAEHNIFNGIGHLYIEVVEGD